MEAMVYFLFCHYGLAVFEVYTLTAAINSSVFVSKVGAQYFWEKLILKFFIMEISDLADTLALTKSPIIFLVTRYLLTVVVHTLEEV